MRIYAGAIPHSHSAALIALQERDYRPGVANPGLVTTFGGLAEGAETAAEAALREIREELGLMASEHDLQELLTHDKIDHDGRSTRCVIYVISVPDVRELTVWEGTGALVGSPIVLLKDSRLTPVCVRAVNAFTARHSGTTFNGRYRVR